MIFQVLSTVFLLGFTSSQASVLETAKQNGCGKLVNLISMAKLKHALESANDVTLFAPSDAAVDAIPPEVVKMLTSNHTLLGEILKFHVVSGVKKSTSIKNDELLTTLDGKSMMRTNIYGSTVTAQGSTVSKTDLQATNGIVHVIDKVIYPVPMLTTPIFLTIDKDLNNLGFLAYQAKLVDKLSEQSLTVFAPTNEAIEKLPGQVYNDLLMNVTELTSVLTYHVVQGTVFSAGLTDGQKVTTLQGAQLEIKIAGGVVTVNGAKVTTADISTTNGAIHVIDTILFPPKQRT